MSHALTCLRDDEDTLGLLFPGMTCPTMICLKRIRVSVRMRAGLDTGMMTGMAIVTREAGRGGTIATRRGGPRAATIIIIGDPAVPRTGLACTTMTRATTMDVGPTPIRTMTATTDREVGDATEVTRALRHPTLATQAIPSSSRACPVMFRSTRLVASRDAPLCLILSSETVATGSYCSTTPPGDTRPFRVHPILSGPASSNVLSPSFKHV